MRSRSDDVYDALKEKAIRMIFAGRLHISI